MIIQRSPRALAPSLIPPDLVFNYGAILNDDSPAAAAINKAAIQASIAVGVPTTMPSGVLTTDAGIVVPAAKSGWGLIGQGFGSSIFTGDSVIKVGSGVVATGGAPIMATNFLEISDNDNPCAVGLQGIRFELANMGRLKVTSAGVVSTTMTLGFDFPHGFAVDDILLAYNFCSTTNPTIASGVSPYNGRFRITAVPTTTSLQFTVTADGAPTLHQTSKTTYVQPLARAAQRIAVSIGRCTYITDADYGGQYQIDYTGATTGNVMPHGVGQRALIYSADAAWNDKLIESMDDGTTAQFTIAKYMDRYLLPFTDPGGANSQIVYVYPFGVDESWLYKNNRATNSQLKDLYIRNGHNGIYKYAEGRPIDDNIRFEAMRGSGWGQLTHTGGVSVTGGKQTGAIDYSSTIICSTDTDLWALGNNPANDMRYPVCYMPVGLGFFGGTGSHDMQWVSGFSSSDGFRYESRSYANAVTSGQPSRRRAAPSGQFASYIGSDVTRGCVVYCASGGAHRLMSGHIGGAAGINEVGIYLGPKVTNFEWFGGIGIACGTRALRSFAKRLTVVGVAIARNNLQQYHIPATGSSYDIVTGTVTLKTLQNIPAIFTTGTIVEVHGVTGTGADIGQIGGTDDPIPDPDNPDTDPDDVQYTGHACIAGTTGTTVKYTIAPGLDITSITGGYIQASLYSGVELGKGSRRVIFSGCHIGAFQILTGRQKYGIEMLSGVSTSATITVEGCDFTGNNVGDILDPNGIIRGLWRTDGNLVSRGPVLSSPTGTPVSIVTTSSSSSPSAWQRAGSSVGDTSALLSNFSASSTGGRFQGLKSRSTTLGGHAAVAVNDVMLSLEAYASDGVDDFIRAGQFLLDVPAVSSDNVVSGRARLLLANAAAAPAEVMRWNADMSITHHNATTVFSAAGHVSLRSYTVGTLPSAATATQAIYVSDGGGSRFVAISDGTNWRDMLGQIIGTSADATLTGALKSSSTTSGIGYSGTGGTVTQATNKSTTVVTNNVQGLITMNAAALAADTTVAFTFTNSAIAVGDSLVLTHESGGTLGAYIFASICAAGSASIAVHNATPGSLSEAVVIRYKLIKGV